MSPSGGTISREGGPDAWALSGELWKWMGPRGAQEPCWPLAILKEGREGKYFCITQRLLPEALSCGKEVGRASSGWEGPAPKQQHLKETLRQLLHMP